MGVARHLPVAPIASFLGGAGGVRLRGTVRFGGSRHRTTGARERIALITRTPRVI